jgi:sugar phosphate isomerase/epimerase
VTSPLILAAGSVLDTDAFGVARAAAAAGFDGIGLRLSHEHAVVDERRRVELRRLLDELELVLHDVEVHRIDDRRDGGDAAATDLARLVDDAAELGAAALLVVSDLADQGETEHRLGTVVDRCRDAGLVAAIEYMAWTTPSRPRAAMAMAVATGAKVVVDLLHHHRVGAGVAELEAVIDSGVLGWVQLADAPASAPVDLVHEARHARLLPGDGGLPLDDLLRIVPTGTVVSVEVQSDRLAADADPAARAGLLHAAAQAALSSARRRDGVGSETDQPPRITG